MRQCNSAAAAYTACCKTEDRTSPGLREAVIPNARGSPARGARKARKAGQPKRLASAPKIAPSGRVCKFKTKFKFIMPSYGRRRAPTEARASFSLTAPPSGKRLSQRFPLPSWASQHLSERSQQPISVVASPRWRCSTLSGAWAASCRAPMRVARPSQRRNKNN